MKYNAYHLPSAYVTYGLTVHLFVLEEECDLQTPEISTFQPTKGGTTCHDLQAWERNTWSAPIANRFRHLWLEPWKLTEIDLGIYRAWSGELWRNLYGSVFWHVAKAVCCYVFFANGIPKTVWFWQLSGVFKHQAQLSLLHHSALVPEVSF